MQRVAEGKKFRANTDICVFALLCGTSLMFAFGALHAASPRQSPNVYELRSYHVKEGKMDALKSRFGDRTDAIFRRHNMKSIGY